MTKSAGAIEEILIDSAPGSTRVALLSGDRLVELWIERASGGSSAAGIPAADSLVGSIHLGRVAKLAPAIDAAFVEIGHGSAGFLAAGDARGALGRDGAPLRTAAADREAPISRLLGEGDALLVQVTRDASGEKGPNLSARLALAGHFLLLQPNRPGIAFARRLAGDVERKRLEAAVAPLVEPGEGVLLRSAAMGATAKMLGDELQSLRAAWREILRRASEARPPALLRAEDVAPIRALREHAGPALRRVASNSRAILARVEDWLARYGFEDQTACRLHRGHEPIFAEHECEEQIAEALEPVVTLPSGGRLVVGRLEALTAIDVDSGRHEGGGRFAESSLAVNLEAAGEIARQIRLRNLAGIIVIDFIHTQSAAHRARVAKALAAAMAEDPVAAQHGGWTRLGLYELARERRRLSLEELMSGSGSGA
jgi:ribonuclease G